MALQTLAHGLDTLMGPSFQWDPFEADWHCNFGWQRGRWCSTQWYNYLCAACLKAWIGSLWQRSCKKVICTIARMILTHALASMKTENTMSVFYNIWFHNNKRQRRAKTTVWAHLVSCVQMFCTTVITFAARIMSIFKKTANISESDLEWLDFGQSGGLSCEVIHTEGCILHAGGHRSVGGAHTGPHIVFL